MHDFSSEDSEGNISVLVPRKTLLKEVKSDDSQFSIFPETTNHCSMKLNRNLASKIFF